MSQSGLCLDYCDGVTIITDSPVIGLVTAWAHAVTGEADLSVRQWGALGRTGTLP